MKRLSIGGTPVWSGWFVRFLIAAVVAGFAGCAATPGPAAEAAKPREALVKERAQARWDALLKNNMAEAYKFYSPASRSVLSYEDFIRSMRVGFWKKADVQAVACQADEACDVTVTIQYAYQGNLVSTPIRETWIRTDGTWWYVQKG